MKKSIKKIAVKNIIFIVIILLFTSCASIPKSRKWEKSFTVMHRREKLEVGDIIVKNKIFKNPSSWFGHAAMVVRPNVIGDYPKAGVGYYELDTYSWLYENRDVMVFKYKYFNKKFKKQFVKNAKKYAHKKYAISGLKNNKNFYCSKYIWYVYFITAKELGYNLDLDSNKGIMVFPYDFIASKDLKQIIF